MSKVPVIFYDVTGRLVDTVTLPESKYSDIEAQLFAVANVRRNANNISVHFRELPENELNEYVAMYLRDENKAFLDVVKSWADAVGATASDIKLAVEGKVLTVTASTIGGIMASDPVPLDDQKAMTSLKTWILSKRGVYASQADDELCIFETHVKGAGLNFLGYLVGLEELGHWPDAARAEGNAWLTPDGVLIFCRGQLLQYSRFVKAVIPGLVELGKSMTKTPAPIDRDAPNVNAPLSPELFFEQFPDTRTPMLEGQVNGILRGFEGAVVTLEVSTALGHGTIILTVDGNGYPINAATGLNNPQLFDLDLNVRREGLLVDALPTDLFDTYYAFDVNFAVDYHRARSAQRAALVVSPDSITIVDGIRIETYARLEKGASTDPLANAETFYRYLTRIYPQRAMSIVDIYVTLLVRKVLQNDYTPTVTARGSMNEAVHISLEADEGEDEDKVFAISDLPSITSWVQTFAESADDPTSAGDDDHDKLADEVIGLASQALVPATEGLNKVAETLAGLRSTRADAPAAVSDVGDRSLIIPVVGGAGAGQFMYNAVFTFDTVEAKNMAADAGFGAQVSRALGMKSYVGHLLASTHIGNLPTYADTVAKINGIPGSVTYSRQQ